MTESEKRLPVIIRELWTGGRACGTNEGNDGGRVFYADCSSLQEESVADWPCVISFQIA